MSFNDKRLLLTVKDVMEIAHVTRRTVTKWIAEGKIEVVLTPGRKPRIYADSVFRPAKEPKNG